MLEQNCLHIARWCRAALPDSTPAWTRRVADAAGRPLGFVRFTSPPRGTWFSWLRGVRLDVFETEDESHLMSVRRPWPIVRAWNVHDAEDFFVGNLSRFTLIDCEGKKQGFLEVDDRGQGTIRDPNNRYLAKFHTNRVAELEIDFETDPTTNPFLRMLLLSAVLTLDAAPERP